LEVKINNIAFTTLFHYFVPKVSLGRKKRDPGIEVALFFPCTVASMFAILVFDFLFHLVRFCCFNILNIVLSRKNTWG